MQSLRPYTINVNGRLMQLDKPKVMGILNLSEDSFYASVSAPTREKVFSRVEKILSEGADIIDVGACSTRPGSSGVTLEEEMQALRMALPIIRELSPEAVVSVDTYRADVAAMCVEEYGVSMINDISAGEMDNRMFDTIARLRVPYIIMHMQGTPDTMQVNPQYTDVVDEVVTYLARRANELHDRGVADVIIDPGFGFGKTLEHNYQLMSRLEELHLLEMPLLVGISRKSMIYRLLDTTPEHSLNGTTALNTVALMKGAHILRVHDVKACRECIQMVEKLRENSLHD
ncbi:MAG: dihydropteroate synthase [Bacteroidaceae bacterium]|nr:dihydropteroate synthase [Bacteroidaceae bacterium]